MSLRALAFVLAGLVIGAAATSADAEPAPKGLEGCVFPAATAFVAKHCAGCHTSAGTDAKKKRAYAVLQLDTYDDWKAQTKVITAVLDKWHLDGKIMPPPKATSQPSDAERKAMLEWLGRGSPNTKAGH